MSWSVALLIHEVLPPATGFRLLPLKLKKYTPAVLNNQVCESLIQRPLETNTKG